MAQFYFHLCGPGGVSRDELGLELPDANHAYLEAYRAVKDMAREVAARGEDPRTYGFHIVDDEGRLLFDLPFVESLNA